MQTEISISRGRMGIKAMAILQWLIPMITFVLMVIL